MLESSLLKIFSSILWSLLKSVRLLFEKLGKWRRQRIVVSTVPQLQIRFSESWKLCLNLWNRRWLKRSLSLVISIKSLGLWQWKILSAGGLMKVNYISWRFPGSQNFLYEMRCAIWYHLYNLKNVRSTMGVIHVF